jgi:Bacterial SH3 domain
MKMRRSFVLLLVLSTALLAGAAVDAIIIKIQASQLRKSPQFFAAALAPLKAGDKLEKVSEANGWLQVKTAAGLVGWVHSSAVGSSKFELAAADKDLKTEATASEVALAAKGFNKKVEDSYRALHADMNFDAVDAMLLMKVSQAAIEDFLKKGRLGDYRGVK